MGRHNMETAPGGEKMQRAIEDSRSASISGDTPRVGDKPASDSDDTVRVPSVSSETAQVPITGHPVVPEGEVDPRVKLIRQYERTQPEGIGRILTDKEILEAADLVNRSASESKGK